ncbi:MAG: hypothetical protein ABSD50_17040 [Smithella sp.]|jgi:hypothetical protein
MPRRRTIISPVVATDEEPLIQNHERLKVYQTDVLHILLAVQGI